MTDELTLERAMAIVADLEAEIGAVVVGQRLLIRRLLTGLLAAIPYATTHGGSRSGCGRGSADWLRSETRGWISF